MGMGKCHDCKQYKMVHEYRAADLNGRAIDICKECAEDRREAQKQAIRSTYGVNLRKR